MPASCGGVAGKVEDTRMQTIIVTAADENFSTLLLGLIQSLRQWDEPVCDAIGVLDLGLSDDTLQKVQGQVTHIVSPDWDLPTDLNLRDSQPYLRAMSSRPFLPKYFPGYDIYLWLDADTWVQERYAVEWFFQAARDGGLGIVPQVDRSYTNPPRATNWRMQRLFMYYGEEAVSLLAAHPYYNSGGFSLLADAPHWSSWARYFLRGLEACPTLVTDQTALNYAIWKDNLPVHPLPALCNWCCHLAVPRINAETRKLCEPHIPNRPIGLVHMTGDTKNLVLTWNSEDKAIEGNLRFRGLSPEVDP
jgi:lipopolysaccharide biosynthesis glycosyltransferase